MRDPVHADVASGSRLVSQPVFRLGSGAFETGGGGSAPDPEDSQIGSGMGCCMDDCRDSQSHLFVLDMAVLCRLSW